MSDAFEKINNKSKVSTENNISLFDDYLSDKLSAQEKNAFEERLESDGKFYDAFNEHRLLAKAVADGAEYDAIRANLEAIHGNIYGTKSKSPLILRPKFYIPIAAAACAVVAFMVIDPFGGAGNADTAAVNDEYFELSADTSGMDGSDDYEDDGGDPTAMYNVEMDSAVVDTFADPDSLISAVTTLPLGTCFLISKNGYFVTAKHLLRKRRKVRLQQKDLGFTFYARKVYVDSFLDFAILKCDEKVAKLLKSVPYKFYRKNVQLGSEVFTLGYPKKDIVYTEGSVSSETGFRSDSNYFEISMHANLGNSGAPLFTEKGELVGIIAGNNTKKQSVTYVVRHHYINEKIDELIENDSLNIDMKSNYLQRYYTRSALIEAIRPFIFEIHSF
ncbi:trypsin-like peptidase domain-containing protein [Crocinitomix catalasitica]|nr:trypsin-like peptidase domain-containing protein [Crocinitomix catalasitica]